MKRSSMRTSLIGIAAAAFTVLAAAGCLLGTDDDAEIAPSLGGGSLSLELFPGLIEEGLDPPFQAPVSDPFAAYDCVNATPEADLCEYLICQSRESWYSIIDLCEDGSFAAAECEHNLNCVVEYVECIEDHCDPATGMFEGDALMCASAFTDCLSYH